MMAFMTSKSDGDIKQGQRDELEIGRAVREPRTGEQAHSQPDARSAYADPASVETVRYTYPAIVETIR